jgi:hypothetical protein
MGGVAGAEVDGAGAGDGLVGGGVALSAVAFALGGRVPIAAVAGGRDLWGLRAGGEEGSEHGGEGSAQHADR